MNGRQISKGLESSLWRLGRNTSISLASQFFVIIAGVVTLYFNARSLGVVGFGKLTLLLSIAAFLEKLLTLQTWQVVQVLGPGREGEIFGGALVFDALALLIAALIGILVTWFFLPEGLLLMAALVFRLQDPALGLLRLRDRFATIAAIEICLALGAALVALALWHWRASFQWYVFGATGLSVIVGFVTLAIACADTAPRIPSHQALRDVFRFALPAGLSSTIGTMRQNGMVPLLGIFAGPAAVGIFSVAERICSVLVILNGAITQSTFREMRSHVRVIVVSIGFVGLSATAGVAAIMILFGEDLITLVAGSAFIDASPVVFVMLGACAVSLACVGLRAAITVNVGPAATLHCDFFAASTLFLAPALIERWGAVGAACSYIAYELGWLIAAILVTRKKEFWQS